MLFQCLSDGTREVYIIIYGDVAKYMMGGKSLCGYQSWTSFMRQLYTAGEGISFKVSFFLLFSYEKLHLVPRKVEIMRIRKHI